MDLKKYCESKKKRIDEHKSFLRADSWVRTSCTSWDYYLLDDIR